MSSLKSNDDASSRGVDELVARFHALQIEKANDNEWVELRAWARSIKESNRLTWKAFLDKVVHVEPTSYYISCLASRSGNCVPSNKPHSKGKILRDKLANAKNQVEELELKQFENSNSFNQEILDDFISDNIDIVSKQHGITSLTFDRE
jgi:hypothetical protein